MYCAECVMRRRIAAIEATGKEPVMLSSDFEDVELKTAYGSVREAFTVIQGTALCEPHLVEVAQIQRVSGLVGANGGQIVMPRAN